MYKWHAAINDNIHKHVLFGVFLCTSLYFSYWMICNTKEKQRTERQRMFPPTAVSALVRALSGKSGWYIFEPSLLNVNQVTLLFLCDRLILLHPFTNACSQSPSEFLSPQTKPADSAFHSTVEAKNSWRNHGTGKRTRWRGRRRTPEVFWLMIK